MQLEEQLNIYQDNYWLYVVFTKNKMSLNLYLIGQNNCFSNKFQSIVNFDQQNSALTLFESGKFLYDLIRDENNFRLNTQAHCLQLKFKIVAHNFQKQCVHKLQLKEASMTKMDRLKQQNYILKKRMHDYQKNGEQDKKLNGKTHSKGIKSYISTEHIKLQDNSGSNLVSATSPHELFPLNGIAENHKNQSKLKRSEKQKNSHQQQQLTPQIKSKRGRAFKAAAQERKQEYPKETRKSKPINKIEQRRKRKNRQSKQNSEGKRNKTGNYETKQNQRMTIKYRRTIVGKKVKLDFENGDSYFGQARDDIYNGYGLYTSKQGSFYEGYWKDGKAQGKGTSVDQGGNKYTGDFVCDKREGKGTQNYQNGQFYEGDFADDQKNGKGKYTYSNGDYYEGEWKNNMCCGRGLQVYIDGTTYEGIWINDEKHGQGILTKPNGDRYKQYYSMGELHKQIVIPSKNRKEQARSQQIDVKQIS